MLDTTHTTHPLREACRSDVREGLQRTPKQLPCRWLYDDTGSQLFEEIPRSPEYHPTRVEAYIMPSHVASNARYMGDESVLIEYGAGAALKTQILLEALGRPLAYVPVDIAGDFLALSARRLLQRLERLQLHPVVADFNEDFLRPIGLRGCLQRGLQSGLLSGLLRGLLRGRRRKALFPGSALGNLDQAHALALMRRMRKPVGEGGRAVIGVDLLKDTSTLLRAYDDAAGVTAAFNLNLLRRINRELNGDLPVHAVWPRSPLERSATRGGNAPALRLRRRVRARWPARALARRRDHPHRDIAQVRSGAREAACLACRRAAGPCVAGQAAPLRRFGHEPAPGRLGHRSAWIDIETAFMGRSSRCGAGGQRVTCRTCFPASAPAA